MERNSLNEALKRRGENANKNVGEEAGGLDDSRRVKVLSPGRLVFKRFVRNRLGVVGFCILVAIFAFSFIGPFFYSYGETQVFNHYSLMQREFAHAKFNTEFTQSIIPDVEPLPVKVKHSTNSYIKEMTEKDLTTYGVAVFDTGEIYTLVKINENVYCWYRQTGTQIGTYTAAATICSNLNYLRDAESATADDGTAIDAGLLEAARAAFKTLKGKNKETTFEYAGESYLVTLLGKQEFSLKYANPAIEGLSASMAADEAALIEAAAKALEEETYGFEYNGDLYTVMAGEGVPHTLTKITNRETVSYYSTLTLNLADGQDGLDRDAMKTAALASFAGDGSFEVDGVKYTLDMDDLWIRNEAGDEAALFTDMSLVDSNSQDTFSIAFKEALNETLSAMREVNAKEGSITWSLSQKDIEKDEEGNEVLVDKLDENGNLIYADEVLEITELTGNYTITRELPFYVIEKFAPMSSDHPFGTDGHGMDMLARMMYGGRVSLMVGFIVVILEMVLGIIMGGIAGYFGGWVDTLIMRLVEIFYCIPSYPILIILGGFMDAARMPATERLYVMMAVLGILGWAGVARMVRGQILSLREQEFMVAAEATGVRVRHRIFRHLVPNVMPQLIVSATSGLGGVILTESSLSFLGLGVKFPLATWGNMIDFVTGLNENLARYVYIWLPVGLLICLTVISFNFVGDALRDAFDPKMKR